MCCEKDNDKTHRIQIHLKSNKKDRSSTTIEDENNTLKKPKHVSDSINEENAISEFKKRKQRRSKELVEGRKFFCVLCNRQYLSRPALHNHQKTKHEYEEFHSLPLSYIEANEFSLPSKKRGRPSKKDSHSEQIENFFRAPKRKNNEININCSSIGNEKSNEDNPFKEFLMFILPKTNKTFYDFGKMVIDIFQEFEMKERGDNLIDKEHIPDLANDFLRYVKEKEIVNTKEEKFELVELIYVFCLWLQDKSYTSARLEYKKGIKRSNN